MAPKTIGVIGLGSIGLRHAKNLVKLLPTSTLGWDPDHDACMAAMRAGVAIYDIVDMTERADALVIASPTKEHHKQIYDACLKGIPTFVEKPLSDINIGALGEYPLMVGYNLRFHSCVKKAKEWLDAGLIGEPLWANFTCAQYNDKPAYTREGVITCWSHEIDLALYLLKSAKAACASASNSLDHLRCGTADSNINVIGFKEDIADICLTHQSGCRTTVHLDYQTKPERRGFIIAGTKGNLHVDLVERFAWIDAADLNHHDFSGEDSYDENYVEEMREFLDRIDGKKTIGCTGSEGLAVLEICLEAKRLAGLA